MKPTPWRIAVIADTHGKVPDHVRADLRKADEIWHLGDFCEARILRAVRAIGPPVRAVAGNNDFELGLPARLLVKKSGWSFLLIHIPPNHPPETHFLLHGHTHVPRDQMVGTTRFLNPGSIGKANKGAPPSFGWLEIQPADGSPATVTWRIQKI